MDDSCTTRLTKKVRHSADSQNELPGIHTTQTELVRCTLQWSLSGHQHVCISSYSQEGIKVQPRILINICTKIRIQYLNQHGIFWGVCFCPSNGIFVWIKNHVDTGSPWQRQEVFWDEANKSNPKVNRGCPHLTANRTSADCVEIAPGSPVQNIPLGV